MKTIIAVLIAVSALLLLANDVLFHERFVPTGVATAVLSFMVIAVWFGRSTLVELAQHRRRWLLNFAIWLAIVAALALVYALWIAR